MLGDLLHVNVAKQKEVLFREGDSTTGFYLIVEGEVKLTCTRESSNQAAKTQTQSQSLLPVVQAARPYLTPLLAKPKAALRDTSQIPETIKSHKHTQAFKHHFAQKAAPTTTHHIANLGPQCFLGLTDLFRNPTR